MNLALGKISSCPLSEDSAASLKNRIVKDLEYACFELMRELGDRIDIPIDYRFVDLLLRTAEDLQVGFRSFSQGVRAASRTRMPRLSALYRPRKKHRLAEQVGPTDHLDGEQDGEACWRSKCSSVREARRKSDRGSASLGAFRKDKPKAVVTARVLFEGTHGIPVN